MNIVIDLTQQQQTPLQRLQSIQRDPQDFNITIKNDGITARIMIQPTVPRVLQQQPPRELQQQPPRELQQQPPRVLQQQPQIQRVRRVRQQRQQRMLQRQQRVLQTNTPASFLLLTPSPNLNRIEQPNFYPLPPILTPQITNAAPKTIYLINFFFNSIFFKFKFFLIIAFLNNHFSYFFTSA